MSMRACVFMGAVAYRRPARPILRSCRLGPKRKPEPQRDTMLPTVYKTANVAV